jgi:hypothetical protein
MSRDVSHSKVLRGYRTHREVGADGRRRGASRRLPVKIARCYHLGRVIPTPAMGGGRYGAPALGFGGARDGGIFLSHGSGGRPRPELGNSFRRAGRGRGDSASTGGR